MVLRLQELYELTAMATRYDELYKKTWAICGIGAYGPSVHITEQGFGAVAKDRTVLLVETSTERIYYKAYFWHNDCEVYCLLTESQAKELIPTLLDQGCTVTPCPEIAQTEIGELCRSREEAQT